MWTWISDNGKHKFVMKTNLIGDCIFIRYELRNNKWEIVSTGLSTRDYEEQKQSIVKRYNFELDK